ncbi:MAG: hypothetical protein HYX78_15870 [Armatimonadetes bacterium]|nr:hypothetical protein [Armatimonadota bacterium]
MDTATQRKLLDYVGGGGKLLIDQALPSRELDHSPASILSRELGVELRSNDGRIPKIKIGSYEIPVGQSPAIISGAGEVLATDMLGRPALCGVEFGDGRVVIAPFDVTYQMRSQLAYLNSIMRWFGIRRIVDAKTIRGQVRHGVDGETFVYLANPYRHTVREEIRVGEDRLTVELPALGIVKQRMVPS